MTCDLEVQPESAEIKVGLSRHSATVFAQSVMVTQLRLHTLFFYALDV